MSKPVVKKLKQQNTSVARKSQNASLLSLIKQVHGQGFPHAHVIKNDIQLKYYPHYIHGHTIRINKLPQDGGATLQKLKSIVDGNDVNVRALEVAHWALQNKNNQLEKAFRLGFIPPDMRPNNLILSSGRLENLKMYVTRSNRDVLRYLKDTGVSFDNEIGMKNRNHKAQFYALGALAERRLKNTGINNTSFIKTGRFSDFGYGKQQPGNGKHVRVLARDRKKLNAHNKNAIKSLRRIENMNHMNDKQVVRELVNRATNNVPMLIERAMQSVTHKTLANGHPNLNNVTPRRSRVIRVKINPNVSIWTRDGLLQHFVNELSARIPDAILELEGLNEKMRKSITDTNKSLVIVNNGRTRVLKIGKNVPRFRPKNYVGKNVKFSTRNKSPISLPNLPPGAMFFTNGKNKTWKFTGHPNSKKTLLGREQKVQYVSEPAGVVFEIKYNAKGSGNIHLGSLYYGSEKPEGGVPAGAVVSSLKRMTNQESRKRTFDLRNLSYVPAPTHNRRVPRLLLPNSYDIYSELEPTHEEVWPGLRKIKQITGAILTNVSLNKSVVQQLLPNELSKHAAKLAAATGKKYTLSQLYNILKETELLNYANNKGLNRAYKKQAK